MKVRLPKHNIEGAFVLVLFAVFAIAIVAVLALGANSYKSLVKRDDDAYNKRIITSYVTAKIRNSDNYNSVKVGSFGAGKNNEDVNTLHLFETVDGDVYDLRIYFYDGYVYELLTTKDNDIEPEAGSKIVEASGLSFEKEDSLLRIKSIDTLGRENVATVALRSSEEVAR